jgi:ribose/xylose/arabinose/galactoside ABC-type transport system permease subunit
MLIGGALVGVLNGFLRIQFQISSFIATLGVGILLSGATQGMSGGSVLYVSNRVQSRPPFASNNDPLEG